MHYLLDLLLSAYPLMGLDGIAGQGTEDQSYSPSLPLGSDIVANIEASTKDITQAIIKATSMPYQASQIGHYVSASPFYNR